MNKIGVCVLIAFFIIAVFPASEMSQHLAANTRHIVSADNETDSPLTLPDNIALSESLRPLMTGLLVDSITFRRQCQVVGATSNLRITIEMFHPAVWVSYRAITTFKRTGGQITATMRIIVPTRRFAEVMGHEFEHVLEQVEGINWRALSAKKGSGVHIVEEGIFETQRAIQVGLEVARESEDADHKR